MNKKRLTILLVLVMLLAWPVIALVSREPETARGREYGFIDTSEKYISYKDRFGLVYYLDFDAKPTTLRPSNVLIFFEAENSPKSEAFLKSLTSQGWINWNGHGSNMVGITVVESGGASKEATEAMLQACDVTDIISKYYNPDSKFNTSAAAWYYKLIECKGEMDNIETLNDVRFDFPFVVVTDLVYNEQSGDLEWRIYYSNDGQVDAKDITLVLQGQDKVGYMVDFDTNGGEPEVIHARMAYKNGSLVRENLPVPKEREGYTFLGWYTASVGGELVTKYTIFTQDTTLYAHWLRDETNADTSRKSGDLDAEKLTQEQIIQLLKDNPITMPEKIFDEEPSIVAPYSPGKLSDTVLQMALNRLNMLRRLAGVPSVELDNELNESAQYGAVWMAAGEKGESPDDMSDEFDQKGWDAFRRSSVVFDFDGVGLGGIIDSFMGKRSPFLNTYSFDNRFYQTNPNLTRVGFGYAPDRPWGSRVFESNHTFIGDNEYVKSTRGCAYNFISWPASGHFPNSLFDKEGVWSIVFHKGCFRDIYWDQKAREDITVILTREEDGKTWTFLGSKPSYEYEEFANEDGECFDIGTIYDHNNYCSTADVCIIFRPDPDGIEKYEGMYTVTIEGLKDTEGNGVDFAFHVNFFNDGVGDEENLNPPSIPSAPSSPSSPSSPSNPSGNIGASTGGDMSSVGATIGGNVSSNNWGSVSGSVLGNHIFDGGSFSGSFGRPNAVKISASAGGTASSNVASTGRGRRVTVSTAPDPGYKLERITVTDAGGKNISITMLDATRCSFIMPAKGVEVKVSFVRTDGKEGPAPSPAPQPGSTPEPSPSPSPSGSPQPAGSVFSDVRTGAYYYEAVKWAVAQGITTGTGPNKFSPDASCTRAQMVTFLWRAAGSPLVSGSTLFQDVAASDYCYPAVLWAVSQGITTGTSATTFSPDAAVTRDQTVTFLYRAAGSPSVGAKSQFQDVASDAYYAQAVQWAVSRDVTNGTGGNRFSPQDDCTRGQIVTFLYRDRAN